MYKEIEKRECSFKSAGAELFGRLFLPQKADFPIPIFVLVCGIGGRKEWFEPVFPREICKKNFALFTFDLRGHCPSTGKLDSNIALDLPSALKYLSRIKELDSSQIIIGGQCLGALLCNSYIAENSNIKGVVNISIFLPDPVDGLFSRRTSDLIMHQIRRSVTHSADIDDDSFFDGFGSRLNTLADAEQISPRPYLLVHYLDDPISPFSRVKMFFNRLNNPNKECFNPENNHKSIISKRRHSTSYDDPEIAIKVGDWIDRNFRYCPQNMVTSLEERSVVSCHL